MKRSKKLILSILSGVLLAAAWPPHGLPFLIFFAFLPFIFISDKTEGEKYSFGKGMCYSLPGLLLWNALTTWWVCNSTLEGSIAMIVLNSLFMSLFFGMWQWFRKTRPPQVLSAISFIALWSSWEYLHLHWDLMWPWLNLGNVFANCTEYVQWYEYTGSFGGTWWILGVNFLIFNIIKAACKRKKSLLIPLSISTFVVIAFPILFSQILYHRYQQNTEKPIEVVVVQQNTDPWQEEYTMCNAEHVYRLLTVAYPLITPNTELLVCPESSIPQTISERALITKEFPREHPDYYAFTLLDTFLADNQQINFILGLSTYEEFSYPATLTAREHVKGKSYVDCYNTSCLYTKEGVAGLYHKSKLVPGVEKMPFPQIFGFLEQFVIDLGGASGSLACDTFERAFPLSTRHGAIKIGCPICYESAFGEHFSQFVKHGANVMCVITNDSWWDDTPGHVQHFLFSKLRAVESRRYVIRAANGGISGIITPQGDVKQPTAYGVRTGIRETVFASETLTFYTRHGDYLARISVAISIISILLGIFSASKAEKRDNFCPKTKR